MTSFKLNFFATAALLASSAVIADEIPKFEIYGTVGAGVISMDGAGTGTNKSFNGYADQIHSSNNVGFRGGKDLGDGLSVKYQLEAAFATATGATGKDSGGSGVESTTGPFFDREANFSVIDKDYGQLKLGRGKNFLYEMEQEFDSRGNWNLGGLKPIARYAGFYSGSNVSRFDRMVRYTSPTINNFKLDAAKSFGNTTGVSAADGWNSGSKSSQNFGIRYTKDDLDIAYTNETSRTATTSATLGNVATEKISFLAANYNLSPKIKVSVGNAATKNPSAVTGSTPGGTSASSFGKTGADAVKNTTTANTFYYGAVYRYTEKLSFNFANYAVSDRVTAGRDNVHMTALGAVYNLGKGLDVNVDYVRANRQANAQSNFTIFDRFVPDGSAISESTQNQSAFALGLQYRW
jgi:predicted porin